MRALILAVIAVFGCGACSSHGSSARSAPTVPALTVDTSAAALKAIRISSCGPGRDGTVQIAGTVRNPSTSPASFVVQLAIRDRNGKRLFATAADAQSVPPRRSAHWLASTTATYKPGMTCTASGYTRR